MKLFKIISKLIFHRRGIFVVPSLYAVIGSFFIPTFFSHFSLTQNQIYDFKNYFLVTPMSDPSVEQSDQCAAPESPHSKNITNYRRLRVPSSPHFQSGLMVFYFFNDWSPYVIERYFCLTLHFEL